MKQIKLSVYTGDLEQLWGRETSIIWGVTLCQAQVDSKDTKLKHPWSLCLVIPNKVGNTKLEECTGEAQMMHCIPPSPGKGGQRGPPQDRYYNLVLENKQGLMNQAMEWQNKRKIGTEVMKPMFETWFSHLYKLLRENNFKFLKQFPFYKTEVMVPLLECC